MDGGLSDLMANGKLGLILNAGSLNMSPQQVVQGATAQQQQAAAQPAAETKEGDVDPVSESTAASAQPVQTAPPVDVFKELNKNKLEGEYL